MKAKTKNLRRIANIVIIGVFVIMLAMLFFQAESTEDFVFIYSEEWSMRAIDRAELEMVNELMTDDSAQKVSLPYAGESSAGDTVIFKNTLPMECAGLTLSFYSTDSTVQVILDGEIIYEYGSDTDRILGKSPGSNENFVDIPETMGEGELLILLTSPYPNSAASLGSVSIAKRDVIIVWLIRSYFVNIVCCLLMLVVAVVLMLIALLRMYTHQPARGELFQGLIGLILALAYFSEIKALSIFYSDQGMLRYLLLLSLPLLMAFYFERNYHSIYPRRFGALWCCAGMNAVTQIVLQIMNIRDLADMEPLSMAVLALVYVVTVISLIQIALGKQDRWAWLLTAAVFVLAGASSYWISDAYAGVGSNTFGLGCAVIFCVMMAVMHLIRLMKEYRVNAEKNERRLKKEVDTVERQNQLLVQSKKDADAARLEAMEANEAKGKFLARMSHEIRTPINAVLGMDEMILRESKEQDIKDYAMDIYTAGQTLLALINDILDFSKIESGKMEIVPVDYDVSSMIHDLVNMISLRAKAKDLAFELEVSSDIPSRLLGDDVRIRQVLTNILTNAVKYTQKGTIWFRVQSRVDGGMATLRFEVEDTGIGIKEEDLPKLSAEFERIEESRNRSIEGTGLGMNITTQLLDLMESKLQVQSVYGQGSKFSFEL